jgi:hypothetical protein
MDVLNRVRAEQRAPKMPFPDNRPELAGPITDLQESERSEDRLFTTGKADGAEVKSFKRRFRASGCTPNRLRSERKRRRASELGAWHVLRTVPAGI